MNWMTAFLWRLQTRKRTTLWLTPPSCRHLLHTMPDSERMKSSSALWQRLSMSSGLNGLRLRNHLAAGSSPFFPEVHEELTKSCRTPTRLTSVLLLQLLSHPLTALKKKDTSTCLLWMSLWPHISARPQLAIGWKARASHPSKLCRATFALAGCTYSTAGQVASALHSIAVL